MTNLAKNRLGVRHPVASIFLIAAVLATACGGNGDVSEEVEPADDETAATDDTDDPNGEETTTEEQPEEIVSVDYAITAETAGPAQAPYSSLPRILGFWEEEGLDVTVTPLAGSGPAVDGLINGNFDAISSGLSTAMAAINEGADLKVFYNQVQSSFAYPAVLADSEFETSADLSNASIGVQALGSGITATVLGLIDLEGGDPSSADVVPVGLGAEALNALQTGRVDALGLWDSQYAGMEISGADLRYLKPSGDESIAFQVGLVAQTPKLDSDPETLVKIARGIAKAYAFAFENPEEAVRLHYEVYPESKPMDVSDDEAVEQGVTQMMARMENSTKPSEGWGYVAPETVDNYAQLLADADALPEALPASDYWDDSLVSDINDFDEDAAVSAS